MKPEILKIYKKILEEYKDKWFTTYDICGAKPIEEPDGVYIWNHDQTELGYFNKILNILTSTNILKRKREYAELHPKIKNRYYMFYKLEKEVDMRIIRAMNTLYKEGYYSNANIWDVKLIHVDDSILLDMNDRINRLEESNKVLSQELKRISENFDF